MKKIKVYDIKEMIEHSKIKDKEGNNLTAFYHDRKLVVIEGSNGKILLYRSPEGVGCIYDLIEEEFIIQLIPLNENKVYMFPTHEIYTTIKEIIEKCNYEEIEFVKSIRVFGYRLETNFKIMLDSLNDIGLDLNDYYETGSREKLSKGDDDGNI